MIRYYLFFAFILIFVSCNKDSPINTDNNLRENNLRSNNFQGVNHQNGIFHFDSKAIIDSFRNNLESQFHSQDSLSQREFLDSFDNSWNHSSARSYENSQSSAQYESVIFNNFNSTLLNEDNIINVSDRFIRYYPDSKYVVVLNNDLNSLSQVENVSSYDSISENNNILKSSSLSSLPFHNQEDIICEEDIIYLKVNHTFSSGDSCINFTNNSIVDFRYELNSESSIEYRWEFNNGYVYNGLSPGDLCFDEEDFPITFDLILIVTGTEFKRKTFTITKPEPAEPRSCLQVAEIKAEIDGNILTITDIKNSSIDLNNCDLDHISYSYFDQPNSTDPNDLKYNYLEFPPDNVPITITLPSNHFKPHDFGIAYWRPGNCSGCYSDSEWEIKRICHDDTDIVTEDVKKRVNGDLFRMRCQIWVETRLLFKDVLAKTKFAKKAWIGWNGKDADYIYVSYEGNWYEESGDDCVLRTENSASSEDDSGYVSVEVEGAKGPTYDSQDPNRLHSDHKVVKDGVEFIYNDLYVR